MVEYGPVMPEQLRHGPVEISGQPVVDCHTGDSDGLVRLRPCPIVPPMAGSATPVYHQAYDGTTLRPNFFRD
ncbi:hypothetical protein ALI144C_15150 [Actinosynnema sp. ALI-1.44]|nr:hypothetical protein ALI144C_15150 [Actinosynnema sp. ALI-1.44]